MARRQKAVETVEEGEDQVQETGQPTQAPAGMMRVSDVERLGAAIGASIREGQAPRRKTQGEFNRTKRTTFHPDPKVKLNLKRKWYQNGVVLDKQYLKDEEISLLNQIMRPGRYVEKRVLVTLIDQADASEGHITYSNTREPALELKGTAATLRDILLWIVTEQEGKEMTAPERQRAFGLTPESIRSRIAEAEAKEISLDA